MVLNASPIAFQSYNKDCLSYVSRDGAEECKSTCVKTYAALKFTPTAEGDEKAAETSWLADVSDELGIKHQLNIHSWELWACFKGAFKV